MVRLKENKSYTEHHGIEKLPPPKKVFLPLIQHIGKPNSPTVKIGDEVFLGQEIASCDAVVSSPVHASVSGRVTAIENWPHPTAGICNSIVIENDGREELLAQRSRLAEEIERLTPDEIRRKVYQAGIVGLGGAGFPTHIKLTPPKPVDTLILNGVECEPYATADHRLMIEKTSQILKGVDLVVRCLGIKQVYIAIEDNKPDAIKAFKSRIDNQESIKLVVLRSQYPQGGEKQLIKHILRKEVPSGKLPFDIGVLVHNVGTLFAIYEAVYKNKPLYERVVTVTGDCLASPKNLLVRLGSPIKELIEFCQPLKNNPAKIIIGGPMMGITQYSEMAPVIKTSSAVILLSSKRAYSYREDSCIRCGECVRNCPVNLWPCLISLAVERNNWELARSYSPLDCIECGLCAYLCPAKRNLVQSIKYAKLKNK
ncbi:MAG: electron transport complex subunit RsxC [Candidatus Omnitrophota bacterium]|jgi:electron transport complex protein RnfC